MSHTTARGDLCAYADGHPYKCKSVAAKHAAEIRYEQSAKAILRRIRYEAKRRGTR